MAKFKVMVTMEKFLYAIVEAETDQEALDKGRALDGADFAEERISGSWNVEGAVPYTGKEEPIA